jgi:hypothetical protein
VHEQQMSYWPLFAGGCAVHFSPDKTGSEGDVPTVIGASQQISSIRSFLILFATAA